MSDQDKSKAQLIQELIELRRHLRALERAALDQVMTQERIPQSKETFKALLDAIPDEIFLTDTQGNLLAVNRSTARRIGAKADDILGKCWFDFFSPSQEEASGRKAAFASVVRDAKPIQFEERIGKEIFDINIYPVLSPAGTVSAVAVLSRDITVRKAAEEKLSWESSLNSALTELYISVLSRSASIEDSSKAVLDQAKALTGSEHAYVCQITEEKGDNVSCILTEMTMRMCRVSGQSQMPFVQAPDGSYPKLWGHALNKREGFFTNSPKDHPAFGGLPEGHVPIERFLCVPVMIGEDPVGQIALANPKRDYHEQDLEAVKRLAEYYALGIYRQRAEKRLRDAEARYRTLVEQTPAITYVAALDEFSSKLYVSPQIESILGFRPSNLQERPAMWERQLHPDDWERVRRAISHSQAKGEPFVFEYRMLAHDGNIVWVRDEGAPVRDAEGRALFFQGVMMDITQRKLAEEQLMRLATAVEQSAESIVIMNKQGKVEYVNPAFEQISGYSREELIGEYPDLWKSLEHDKEFFRNIWKILRRGEVWKGRIISRRKDGKLFHEDATISPTRDSVGAIVSYVAVRHDVTQRVELERQLLQAQKMEAIGNLAGGIAHDFNNLLTIVLGYSELLLVEETIANSAKADLQKIVHAARNGSELVRRLLTFSRKTETMPRPVNLNSQIQQVENLLWRTIPKMIKIELILADDLLKINADPAQMEQVLMNLALNARDAMPEGGKLTIQTKNAVLDEEYCKMHLDATPGHYALLIVSDTGHGMTKETFEHLFEPFYTTKAPGKGTGLGLATVYGIVKQHGGRITCYSEPGRGTVFKIYLPAMDTALEPEGFADQPKPRGGTETILLVDDEELVRALGQDILTRSGYRVITACDGRQALEIYQKELHSISLIIVDLIMPEMGGKQCIEGIMKINPQAKILVSSGYSAEGLSKDIGTYGAKGFLSKPHEVREILQKVRDVLDADE